MDERCIARRALWVLVAGCMGFLSIAGCDRLQSVERLVESAQAEFDAADYPAAMQDVKTALERDPGLTAARVLLARIYLRIGDPASARQELARAVEANADPEAFRGLHYAILLAQGDYEAALVAARVDRDDRDASRLVVLATAQTALGQYDRARKSVDEALALAPEEPEVCLAEVRLLWATGEFQQAQEALDRLVRMHPGFARGSMFQGRYAMALGDAARAGEAFGRALETGAKQLDLPEQLSIRVGLVESHLALGDAEGAEVHVKALESRAPGSFLTSYLKARLAYARRDFAGAAGELERALAIQPGHAPARLMMAAALVEQGSLERADSVLAELLADQPENIEARKLLARVHLLRNDPAGAQRLLAEAPEQAARDPGADWLSGSILLMAGRTDEAIALLEQSVKADPGNVPLGLDLAQAYLMRGRPERALDVLAALPPGQGGLRRRQLAVLAEVAGKKPDEAREAIGRLARESAGDAGLLVVSGHFLLTVGARDEARALFGQALAADDRNADARLGLAMMSLQEGDAGSAEKRLLEVAELDPADERAFLGLAAVAFRQADRAAARQWLERAVSADPAVVESRLQLADLAYADKDPARAEALIEQALAVAQNRPATLNRVGQVLMRGAQFDVALGYFNEAAALGVEEAGVNAAVAMLALGRQDEARGRLEALINARPGWLAPLALLVGLDSDQGRFEQALARVGEFEKAGGDRVAADELSARVMLAAGRHEHAAEAYARAFRTRPTAQLAVRLFGAQKAAGRSLPETALVDWLEKNPEDRRVRLVLAEYYQQTGDRKAAVAQYELALRTSETPEALNNLAWLYYETGDSRAIELARRAHEAAPERPEITDTYGWILLEKGETDEALEILEKAVNGAPEHPEIRYHHAAALAAAGRRQDAAQALRELLQAAKSFPSRGEAEALLSSLAGG